MRKRILGQDQHAVRRALIALDAGGMASWQWDAVTGYVEADEQWSALYGFEPGEPVHIDEAFSRVHPDDIDRLQAEVRDAVENDRDYEAEFRICRPDDEPQWIAARGRVVEKAEDGSAKLMFGVNWDLTDVKEQEANLALLASEMDHRVKNAFAVIKALITIGGRTAESKEALVETLSQQVHAMAEAHRVSAGLAREKARPRVAVPVGDVVRSALAPWLNGERGERDDLSITLDTDDEATLAPHQVSPTAMLAYELATNAAKHGPLGEAGGRLSVTVTALSEAEGAENVSPSAERIRRTSARELVMTWHEEAAGRTNAAREAERGSTTGFGSVLLQHCAGTLGAEFKRELRPEGLHVELRWPVAPLRN